RQRRFSSASNHNSPFLLAHRSSQPEIKRLSGAFNAPTNIEVERHEDHKKSSRGADRLRKWEDRVKGWKSRLELPDFQDPRVSYSGSAITSRVYCGEARGAPVAGETCIEPASVVEAAMLGRGWAYRRGQTTVIMGHYPEIRVSEHEHSDLRHDSASSVTKSKVSRAPPTQRLDSNDTLPESVSSPDSAQHLIDSDSAEVDTVGDMDLNSHTVEAEYRRYTHAPPPYSEDAYDGKTEDEQNGMRIRDYAREISRQMGKQLVKDLTSPQVE
ncbi:hypothetical protein P153DRAFT_281995, partial [Dothidotthia symphoricarpi CBS 119687]